MSNRSAAELSKLPIAELRAIASKYSLPLRRDMTVADIAAMVASHEGGYTASAPVAEDNPRPAPGWARIEIQRDPSPGSSNGPIFAGVNGYQVLIKRGVKVDVPIKILRGSLLAAEAEVLRENPNERDLDRRFTYEKMLTLPLIVYDIHEGPDPRNEYELTVKSKNKNKRAFRAEHGYWPKPVELKEWLANKSRDKREASKEK